MNKQQFKEDSDFINLNMKIKYLQAQFNEVKQKVIVCTEMKDKSTNANIINAENKNNNIKINKVNTRNQMSKAINKIDKANLNIIENIDKKQVDTDKSDEKTLRYSVSRNKISKISPSIQMPIDLEKDDVEIKNSISSDSILDMDKLNNYSNQIIQYEPKIIQKINTYNNNDNNDNKINNNNNNINNKNINNINNNNIIIIKKQSELTNNYVLSMQPLNRSLPIDQINLM